MNIILLSLTSFVVLYIAVCAFKYALGLVLTSTFIITGLVIANHYGGLPAMSLTLAISPVLYIAIADLITRLRSAKPFFDPAYSPGIEQQDEKTEVVETAPLTGEWISGKTPELTFQQPLIGDVTALPRSWL